MTDAEALAFVGLSAPRAPLSPHFTYDDRDAIGTALMNFARVESVELEQQRDGLEIVLYGATAPCRHALASVATVWGFAALVEVRTDSVRALARWNE